MATRKKAKTKARKKKKSPARKTKARKKVVRRPAAKKAVAKKKKPKAAPKARKPAAKAAARPKPAATPAIVVPAGEERIGMVTHYYNHLSVAILKLDSGMLRVGDTIHIKGHTSDFYQRVESMEIDHVHVNEARPGQSFGVKVKDHAREHDGVYKVTRV